MKTRLLFLCTYLVTFVSFSQTNYKKGMFVNNDDEKVECYIKSSDWRNNPTEFEYRFTENGETNTESIINVKLFEIYEFSKYIRATVNVDRSSVLLEELSPNRNPEFKEETLFLKFIIEGEASIYRYVDGNFKRFFYNLENKAIEQLVYKEYLYKDSDVIAENNHFRQQLLTDLKCNNIKHGDIRKLKYEAEDLAYLFDVYNRSNGSIDTNNYEQKEKRDWLNLRAKIGVGLSSLEINNYSSDYHDADFGNKIIFRIGLESEFVIPFNNNKWSLVAEPSYQKYSAQKDLYNPEAAGVLTNIRTEVNYSTIEIPVGIRHYFFLNDDSKIFVNAFYSLVLAGNSEINDETIKPIEITNNPAYSIGLGYSYKKFSLEGRYEFPREILGNYVRIQSNYNQITLIFGYQFF